MDSSSCNDEYKLLKCALYFGLNIVSIVKYLSDFNDEMNEISLYLSSVGDD